MRKTIYTILAVLTAAFTSPAIFAQASVPGYHDPALSRNKLLREQQGEGAYKLIGTYKVKGFSYLFAPKLNADIYSVKESARNIRVTYDTYNQEIEFYSSANPVTALVKAPGEIDSFVLKQNPEAGIMQDILFVYGPLIGTSEKAYFQVIATGARVSIYKRYKSELGYVSDNYIQSELRQFDMISDYFYYDTVTQKMKKLKFNLSNVIKEFKSIKDISAVVTNDEYSADPEAAIRKIAAVLNEVPAK